MARYLWVDRGTGLTTATVVNVVDYPDPDTVPDREGNFYILADQTGTANAGDTIDLTDTVKVRKLRLMDSVIFSELLRLTNELRTLQLKSLLTSQQYTDFLKTQIDATKV